jgi:hypothetical protein
MVSVIYIIVQRGFEASHTVNINMVPASSRGHTEVQIRR